MRLIPKLAILLCLLTVLPTVWAAENSEQAQDDLEQVNTAIADIQSWLDDANERQTREERRLREAEQELARLTDSVNSIVSNIDATESELGVLQQRQERLASEKAEQDQLLAQAIRAAYMAGDQNSLKLLLNQEDLSASGRLLHYARVFSEHQLAQIEAYRQTLAEIAEVNSSLESRLTDLGNQRSQLEQRSRDQDAARTQREQALAALNSDIARRSDELEQLEIDQAELQALIDEITRAMEGVQSFDDVPPFNDQRGRLPLPARGEITSRFGSRYGEGSLSRQGITIGLSEGTQVQAVHAGRVVFADWLRGAGLLLIVDHGDGYMSLYGANQALASQAGDWVDAGDIVAISGRGGEGNSPGLYFEIRHHGEAQNPANWLQSGN